MGDFRIEWVRARQVEVGERLIVKMVPPSPDGQNLRSATIDDLKRGCEAVGLHVVEKSVLHGIGVVREQRDKALEQVTEARYIADLAQADNATLRAQLDELRATSTVGRATDEELWRAYDTALQSAQGATHERIIRQAVLAVAARVRRERPACLVERLVAAKADFDVRCLARGWDLSARVPGGQWKHVDLAPAADVPSTLARLAGLDGGR